MTGLEIGVTAMLILALAGAIFAHFTTKHTSGHNTH